MLEKFLLEIRADVLKSWFQLILGTYPSETVKLLGLEKDPFVNPVGQTIKRAIEAIYDGLLSGMEVHEIKGDMERILQIRSVQDFSPSRAVVFIFLLKTALRDELERSGMEAREWMANWLELESRIDELSLLAFDIYSTYRERIFEIRISEIRKDRDRMRKLIERS